MYIYIYVYVFLVSGLSTGDVTAESQRQWTTDPHRPVDSAQTSKIL